MAETSPEPVFAPTDAAANAIPIALVRGPDALDRLSLSEPARAWVQANNFTGKARSLLLVPSADGGISRVLFGLGKPTTTPMVGPPENLIGSLPNRLPRGTYALESDDLDYAQASIAWGLGAYLYDAFKPSKRESEETRSALQLDASLDLDAIRAFVEAICRGRDLINRPANDLGPADLADEIRQIGSRHGAKVTCHSGADAGFAEAFPLVAAVGRASDRPPYVIDLTWGETSAPSITLVGKGITFDTGGLDLKPAAGMRLMKKDMGGSASAITLARMIMQAQLPVRLRLIVAAADNAVAGSAFRPGDILKSRSGLTVEIGNTDAEGRLVLADALSLADEADNDLIVTFATLTGAARVALGPDLPAMFTTDNAIAEDFRRAGLAVGDPVWQLPFWDGYDTWIDGNISDLKNIADKPFAGAIVAALFLKRFVKKSRRYLHFDMFGWRQDAHPLGPVGGEVQTVRALFRALSHSETRLMLKA